MLIQSNASIVFSSNTFIIYAIEFAPLQAISSSLSFGDTELIHIIDPASIASTAAVDINNMLVHIIDYASIASTLSISNLELQLNIIDINIPGTLSIGVPALFRGVSPASITSTTVVDNNNELVHVIDYASITSTTIVSDPLLQITIDDVNASTVASFGTTELVFVIDTISIESTVNVSNNINVVPIYDIDSIASSIVISNLELLLNISDISVPSSTIVPPPNVFQLGNGTVTNIFVNTINDLSTEQIAKYGNLTINSVPGNKIFEGTNTTFTTQLVQGSIIIVIDVNDTNEEFMLTVDSINDDVTMSVTSNVLYSNSSFAIVNNAIFLYS